MILCFILGSVLHGAQGLEVQSLSDSVGIQLVPIRPGTFTMGADLSPEYITSEEGIFIQDELPARQVTLTYGFTLSKYEITNVQYEQYDPNHAAPVGYVTGSCKVVRGGCHNVHMQTLRSANRSSSNRTDRHFLLALRVVRVPKAQVLPRLVGK